MKLNQLLQQNTLGPVEWVAKEAPNGAGLGWEMEAVVQGRLVGSGTAPSKARAKNMAAEAALKVLLGEEDDDDAGFRTAGS